MKALKYLLTPTDDILTLIHDTDTIAIYKYRDNTIINIDKIIIDDGKSNYRTFKQQ